MAMCEGSGKLLDMSSDIVNDFSCTPCENDGKHIEALFYCLECGECFCSACLRNHNRYAIMKTHTILDKKGMAAMKSESEVSLPTEQSLEKEEVNAKETGPVPAIPTEKCPEHHGNLLDTYCPDCDAVCCPTCIFIDHRFCDDITYIPKAAKGIMESKQYRNIIPSVERIHGRLQTLKEKMDDDLKKIDKDKSNVLTQIRDFRKSIDNELDRLEKYVCDNIQAKYTIQEKQIQSKINSLEDMLTNLKASLKKLENIEEDNESDMFVKVKIGRTRKSSGKSLLQDIKGNHVKETLFFIQNKELDGFMKSLANFGVIEERGEDTDANDDSSYDSNDDSSNDSSAKSSDDAQDDSSDDQNDILNRMPYPEISRGSINN